MNTEQLHSLIRDVPDFPRPGIVFKDISPLLAHPDGFAATITELSARLAAHNVDRLLAIESRGFLFAAPIAAASGLPLHLVRKAGKLPFTTVGIDYELEYGVDRLEMHTDSLIPGQRYAVIDDVLATGGTAAATAQLLRNNDAELACFGFLLELSPLKGRDRLAPTPVECLLSFN